MKNGLYMYSVIRVDEDRSFGPIGLSEDPLMGEEVYVVRFNDIACVVSSSPIMEWEINRDNVVRHQKVNEEVMKTYTTLPVKFCTIAESRDQIVEKFLKSRHDELIERIDYFSDKREYGVRAHWIDMEKTYEELLAEKPRLKERRDRLAKLPFEKARNDMIVIGEDVQKALKNKKELMEETLFEELKPLAIEAKTGKIMGDRMVLNGVFLILETAQKDFDAYVNMLSEKHKHDLKFRYVGPTPPANFIEIVVSWD